MTIRVGNAPVSWGIYGPDDTAVEPEVFLDAIREAGYVGTELGPYGFFTKDPDELKALLEPRGLALGSSFVCMKLGIESERQNCIDDALRVGRLLQTQGVGEVIAADDGDERRKAIAGRVTEKDQWTDAQWAIAIETLNQVARALRDELGMSVVVHHHAGTYIETYDEIARVLESTDGELINLVLDTGHAVYGGADPVKVIENFGDRVTYMHYKDVDPAQLETVRNTDIHMDDAWKAGVFCQLGEGVIDFPRITQQLRERNFSGWLIVEQDVVPDENGQLHPDPFVSAKASRNYLKEKLGL